MLKAGMLLKINGLKLCRKGQEGKSQNQQDFYGVNHFHYITSIAQRRLRN